MSDHEHDTLIDEIASELKRPVRFSESFDARVMSAIRTAHLSVIRGERAHAVPGRRRVLIPAFAALAAAAALTIMVVRNGGESSLPEIASNVALTPVANVPGEERNLPQDIALSVYLPGAKKVAVLGAFNDWDASRSPMERGPNGVWTVRLKLPPGSYEYQFLADGSTRMTDPTAPATDSEFGEANSVMTVTPRMVP